MLATAILVMDPLPKKIGVPYFFRDLVGMAHDTTLEQFKTSDQSIWTVKTRWIYISIHDRD